MREYLLATAYTTMSPGAKIASFSLLKSSSFLFLKGFTDGLLIGEVLIFAL